MNFKKVAGSIALIFVFSLMTAQAQQWGLYTLYAPQNSTAVYLVDTNGTTYKQWTLTGKSNTSYSTYLNANKQIVRTATPTSNPFGGGGGLTGRVQLVNWDGTLAWDYTYTSSTYCLHHDFCQMPNGNFLFICYESKTSAEATQAGCSSATAIDAEKIIEVQPTGATTGTIVWEWHLWDHLCQNYNSGKDNYVTSIVNNPQLFNINYNTSSDWFHMNGIDYNAELDQIVLSSHNMNQVFIIDHSTTTAQAAGHTGGNAGKGGDFLYRWGNPTSYGASGTTIFNVVHDAHWVPANNPNYPNYLCAFNNKGGTGSKSAMTIWNPPLSGYNYTITLGSAYTPSTYAYQYSSSYSAQNMGNSQQLPNGNSLMNIPGAIIEINSAGTTLWTKSANSPHAYRYSLCYVRGPVASATAGASTVCAGDVLNLTSSATSVSETSPTYSYSWSSSPAGFTSTQQNPTANPATTATYTVTITNTAIGCSSSASVSVNVNPLPSVPTITQAGNTLNSTTATAYQWYLNGSLISGAVSQAYTPTQSGSYTVEITDANGCSNTSSAYNYVLTGFEGLAQEEFLNLYPNPSTGMLNIEGVISTETNYSVDVFSTFGKLIFHGENIHQIDLSAHSNGLYFVVITPENAAAITNKLILQK